MGRIETVLGPPNVPLDVLDKPQTCFEAQEMTHVSDDSSPDRPGVRCGRYSGRMADRIAHQPEP